MYPARQGFMQLLVAFVKQYDDRVAEACMLFPQHNKTTIALTASSWVLICTDVITACARCGRYHWSSVLGIRPVQLLL